MASTTVRPSSASSPPEQGLPAAQLLACLAGLADPARRRESAYALAECLGADVLLVFVADPESGVPLPAPGFPQTLPGGRAWRAFLAAAIRAGSHTDTVPFPHAGTLTSAWGIAGPDGSAVLVLLGGSPDPEGVACIRQFVPILAAVFRGERSLQTAAAQAALAREAAAEARALAEALDRARHELQGVVRTQDEFLAAAAHDLKNPLTAIKGVAQILKRRMASATEVDPERLRAGLESIEGSVTQMTGLINELLDLARVQMGRPLELHRAPTDLVALARGVVADHQQSTDRHTLRVEAADPDIVGSWDAVRLGRVLGNLVGNAIKFSPQGGEVAVQVARDADGQGAWAVLQVRDQGIGIPAEDLPRVFERFRRAGNVIGRIPGTGIGLAASRQIVDQHGGTIAAESREGEGSTFTVRLPLAAQQAANAACGATLGPAVHPEHVTSTPEGASETCRT